jgi:hypothetical protein
MFADILECASVNAKERVAALARRATRRFGCQRFGCDRILLRWRPTETENRAQTGCESGGCRLTIPADRRFVVEHGCVIGTIRNEDIAQSLDKSHDCLGV